MEEKPEALEQGSLWLAEAVAGAWLVGEVSVPGQRERERVCVSVCVCVLLILGLDVTCG